MESALRVVRRLFEQEEAEEGVLNPLTWWKERPEFSVLYPLVRLIFSASPTSAPIERIFSSATFEDDAGRHLSAETIKKLVVLKEFKRRNGTYESREPPRYVQDAAQFLLQKQKPQKQ